MVKEVLSKVYIYEKPSGTALTKLLVQGLVTYEAQKWAKHRKVINPAFLQERVKVIELFNYQCICRFIPTKRNKRMSKIKEEVKALIKDMINRRMQAMEAGEVVNNDLLGLLLESNNKEIQEHGKKSVGMSMDEVIEECKMFYFVGQETTSILLVWSMILLSKNLDWQERAREEVLNMFGTRTPEHDELNHLKIVTMILNEVLRLYTPAVMYTRLTTGETKLAEISLPAGVQLLMPIILIHYDKQIWGEDAEQFNPERFREGVTKAAKGQLAFFPFGWGPRACIGQNFAILEAKMALAMILQRFTFELSPSYTHAPYIALTLQPQHGAQLYLRRRV